MIDFHCHLDLFPNPAQVVEKCVRRNLYILSVTTTPSAWIGTSALAEKAPRIRTALGLHPQLAHQRRSELPLFEQLLSKTRYVGEIGLDATPEFKPFWNEQVDVFIHILDACRSSGGRILSIHSRRAVKEVLDYLQKYSGAGIPILHWFSGTHKELDRAIGLDCWFSVGPAMLAGEKGRKLVAAIPRDRLLTETDGPFARLGDQSLMPWDVKMAIDQLSEIWHASRAMVEQQLAANLKQLAKTDINPRTS